MSFRGKENIEQLEIPLLSRETGKEQSADNNTALLNDSCLGSLQASRDKRKIDPSGDSDGGDSPDEKDGEDEQEEDEEEPIVTPKQLLAILLNICAGVLMLTALLNNEWIVTRNGSDIKGGLRTVCFEPRILQALENARRHGESSHFPNSSTTTICSTCKTKTMIANEIQKQDIVVTSVH